jgi:hypothetical protein
VLKSTDGASWTGATLSPASNLSAIVVPVTNSQFLAVGDAGAVVTSPDGVTWTAKSSGTTASLQGLITAQVQYVAVGTSGVNLNSH